MKKTLLSAVVLLLLANTLYAQTTLVFGVKPGLIINSAYLGIQQGIFLPYLGTDLLWISAEGNYEKSHEDYQTPKTFSKEITTIDFSGKAFLLIPQLGAKCFLGSRLAKPYVSAALFFGLPIVDITAQGTRESWEYENDQLLSHQQEAIMENFAEIEKTVKEALGFWGFTLAAGAEYFFNPQFSLGGEYGLRIIFDSASYDKTSGDFESGAISGYRNKWKTEVSASLKASYAVISVNFYF